LQHPRPGVGDGWEMSPETYRLQDIHEAVAVFHELRARISGESGRHGARPVVHDREAVVAVLQRDAKDDTIDSIDERRECGGRSAVSLVLA
jgi:hypothetical protein